MSPAAKKFTVTVERFCEWAEGHQHGLIESRQLLVSLIAAIPNLLEFRHSGASDEVYPRRDYDGWKEDHKRFADLPFQYYRVVFDSFDFDSSDEPVTSDLHDDFADIYGDLWHGLQAYQSGDPTAALSLWVDSYLIHWGHHATSALGAIDAFFREDSGRSG